MFVKMKNDYGLKSKCGQVNVDMVEKKSNTAYQAYV